MITKKEIGPGMATKFQVPIWWPKCVCTYVCFLWTLYNNSKF